MRLAVSQKRPAESMEDPTLPVSRQAVYTANQSAYRDQACKGGTQLSTGNLSPTPGTAASNPTFPPSPVSIGAKGYERGNEDTIAPRKAGSAIDPFIHDSRFIYVFILRRMPVGIRQERGYNPFNQASCVHYASCAESHHRSHASHRRGTQYTGGPSRLSIARQAAAYPIYPRACNRWAMVLRMLLRGANSQRYAAALPRATWLGERCEAGQA